jgi:hypothetical protein
MDESEIIREAMRLIGRRKSERKTRACRENARRPRKGKRKRKRTVSNSDAKSEKRG